MKQFSNRIKNLRIKHKIFIGILITSIISIYLIFVTTAIIMYNYHIRLTSTASMKELDYITKQLDTTLNTVENFGKTIAVTPSVQTFTDKFNAAPETFNPLDAFNLKNDINTIIQSTPFIHSVSIYSSARELIATTDNATTPPNIDGINISENIWISREKIKAYYPNQTVSVISYIQEFYGYNDGKLLGYIEISIPETSISNIYNNKSTHHYSNQFIVDHHGFVRSTDGSYKLYQYYADFLDIIVPESSGFNYVNDDIVFYKYYDRLDWYLVYAINRNFFLEPMYSLILVSAGITILGLILASLLSLKISKTITMPIDFLIRHIQKVIKGDWTPLNSATYDKDIQFLYHEFNAMLKAQTKLTSDLINEQQLKEKLSLDLLQQQVNPHFLYNALDNICSLAEMEEKDILVDVVMNLSNFYREALNDGSIYITIGQELSIIESYLKIMLVRYYQKFDYTIECSEYLKNKQCLKLLLQPIVENSIYHGIKQMNGKGHIQIRVFEEDGSVYFHIQDNGIGIKEETIQRIWDQDSRSFGLKNANQRIKLYYGDDYGITISKNAPKGCLVIIRIKA